MPEKRNAKGAGWFKTRPDGKITYTKSAGFLPNGGRKRLTVTASSKQECIRLMRKKELEYEKKKKSRIVDDMTTVVSLCDQHLLYQVEHDELTRKSWDRRETTVQRHIGDYDFGHYQAASVTPADVEEHISNLLQEKRLSGSSIKKVVDVLNAAYNWAYERGTIDHNPVLPIKRSLVTRIYKQQTRQENDADVIVLSESEQKRFEDHVRNLSVNLKRKELFGLYGLLLLKTGLRIGELCACRWSDYDENTGILVIRKSHVRVKNRARETADTMHTVTIEKSTKNQKARRIELFDDARKILEEIRSETRWNKPDDYIIATRSGNPNTATNMEARIRRVFRDSGIFTGEQETGSLHIFRRTFATNCYYKKSIPLKLIAAYMGDLESTVLRYYIAAREKIVSADGEVQQVVRLHVK